MVKKTERRVNVSGKPKHSLDSNRSNAGDNNKRSAATVRRLKVYNTRPKRDRKGKIIKHDLQSKELPSTRIQPDRRWFGNTRVVGQKELELFREELQSRMSSNYNVLLKERKLPMSLLNDHQKQARAHLLDTEPFDSTFGPKNKRKRPKLLAFDYESLIKKADNSQDAFEQKLAAVPAGEGTEEDGLRDLVRHTMFEKGQSKRIWGELYKVVDSSDVVVQMLSTKSLGVTDSTHAETMAVLSGLRLFKDKLTGALQVEGDSLNVIRWCKMISAPPWRLITLFREIWDLGRKTNCSWNHVSRSQNSDADALAKDGVSLPHLEVREPP